MAQLPEFVRRRVLFQHEVLRALLRRLAHAAERTLRGEPAEQDLRDAERTLHDVLEVHVRQEEATLAPLLRARWDPDRLGARRPGVGAVGRGMVDVRSGDGLERRGQDAGVVVGAEAPHRYRRMRWPFMRAA